MRIHHVGKPGRPSTGGWIGIGYGTVFIGSALTGVVIHPGSMAGFGESFAIALVVSFMLWWAVASTNHR